MSRVGGFLAVLVAGAAAGAAGYAAGQNQLGLVATQWVQMRLFAPSKQQVAPSSPVIYYRDPDGKPDYAASPRKTADGRPFTPVLASEDVSFDARPKAAVIAPAGAPATTSDAAVPRKILYYRNPMGLADTSKTPKKDSMGMPYIPVYAGGADDEPGTIIIPQGQIQSTGVKSQVVKLRQIVTSLHVPGVIELDERRVSVVAMRSDAFVDKVANVTTGEVVHKGEPLLQLYSPEIAAASAQYISGLANRGFDNSGALQRLHNLAVPDSVIEQMRANRKIPNEITWTAPQDGVVVTRDISAGMQAKAGAVLFKLANIADVWVVADLPEYELNAAKVGARARVTMRGMPGRVFKGKIDLIYPQISAATRTAKVRIQLANPDGLLLPNMYADVIIAEAGAAPVVAVPNDAVIVSGSQHVVILDKGRGRFEPHDVEVGQRGDGFTRIRKGVRVGDRVVVAANFLINADSNLQAALNGLKVPQRPTKGTKP